jgi:iron complex transport system substrate-binding protein
VGWREVAAADPDVIVVMCCGFSVERTLGEIAALGEQAPWKDLRAVREGRVYVADGAAYFSRPGPRVADGVELLGACLHPGIWPTHLPPQAVCRLASHA